MNILLNQLLMEMKFLYKEIMHENKARSYKFTIIGNILPKTSNHIGHMIPINKNIIGIT